MIYKMTCLTCGLIWKEDRGLLHGELAFLWAGQCPRCQNKDGNIAVAK